MVPAAELLLLLPVIVVHVFPRGCSIHEFSAVVEGERGGTPFHQIGPIVGVSVPANAVSDLG